MGALPPLPGPRAGPSPGRGSGSSATGNGGAGPVERASPDDLMQLALDAGPTPMQIGAVLRLADGSPEGVARLVGERLATVPRLRQVLRRTPLGAGRPVWVDDPAFRVERHVAVVRCPAPGDEPALLDVAVRLLGVRMGLVLPPWRVAVVGGLADPGVAIVLVLHHVVADGAGMLAILAALADGGRRAPVVPPRPAPTATALRSEAWRGRLAAVRRTPDGVRVLRDGLRELRVGRPPRFADSPLTRPTDRGHAVRVVRLPLADVREAAHAVGATVNDVVLTAVGGGLGEWTARHGESLGGVVASVPVAAPRSDGGSLGNRVGVMPVLLPTRGPARERLVRVAATTRQQKSVRRGASAALTVPAFRTLGAVGLLGPAVSRQALVQTFVTNVRGPAHRVAVGGATVTGIVPLTAGTGNVTVAVAVLSYAGELTLALAADTGAVPDLAVLVGLVRRHLFAIVDPGGR